MQIQVPDETPVAELQERLAAGGMAITPQIKHGAQRYILTMFDTFFPQVTPEQRASASLKAVEALAESLSRPVPFEVVK